MLKTLGNIIISFDNLDEFRNLLITKKVGIYNLGPGIGDHVYHTYFPEIYFKNVGRKVVDLNNKWCYDYNPYVERNQRVDIALCPWCINDRIKHIENAHSISEFIFGPLGFKIELRHPRLYRFENSKKIANSICVHTDGKSMNTHMSDEIIETIQKKYDGWEIFQIKKKNDRSTPFIDKKGLSMWDTAELISKCSMFIGMNSGMLHIANCYPSVWKKVILDEINYTEIEHWNPLNKPKSYWLDSTNTYFNTSDHDIGMTYSYKEL